MDRICVVVLNWNNAAMTIRCLRFLRGSTWNDDIDIIVVDNGSDDIEEVQSDFKLYANHLIKNKSNLGFAGGCNIGVNFAIANSYEWIMILNNDAISDAKDIIKIRDIANASQERNAYSPIITDTITNEIWFAGGKYDKKLNRPIHVNVVQGFDQIQSDYLTGCSIFARRNIWQEVGLFDPKFFLIFEDSDWSIRARKMGVELIVLPNIVIHHEPSSTFKKNTRNTSTFFFIRNGVQFNLQNFGIYEASRFAFRYTIRDSISDIIQFRFDPFTFIARIIGLACAILNKMNEVPKKLRFLVK